MTAEKPKYSLGQIIISSIMTIIVFLGGILLLGGDLNWIEGWIFGIWIVTMILSITFYTYLKDPALLAERTQSPGSKNQKTWDKYLVIAIYIIALSWLIIMPLDARRFLWSPVFPLWIKLFGGVVLLPSIYLIVSATVENTYLSTLVRIQDDRKQHVISTGIYSFVRHPLYLGCFLMMFAAPLLLGSVLGLIISVIGFIAIIGRIIGEEAMLTIELEGYEDYKKKVIYRLIPYIW
jgi:protein-S-isoprenylcysteine O-methyltransferase Ste14